MGVISAGNTFFISIDANGLSSNNINYFQDFYQGVITSIGSDVGKNGFTGLV
jgi:hypothetical protein